MEVKTRYNIGDEVWTMLNNRPHCFRISGIEVYVTHCVHSCVTWSIPTQAHATIRSTYTFWIVPVSRQKKN